MYVYDVDRTLNLYSDNRLKTGASIWTLILHAIASLSLSLLLKIPLNIYLLKSIQIFNQFRVIVRIRITLIKTFSKNLHKFYSLYVVRILNTNVCRACVRIHVVN